ncbi:MAG TPA: histidine phosphatase family protein [Gemmataceae bacterium]|nr:histidine phosphatase family protein [Gemmataceae bacterium]
MDAREKIELPARRRIYLLRHGDVAYFDGQGRPFHPGTVPLTAAGRAQAEAAARELAAVPFDRAVSSDLPRCTETAGIVTAGRGLTVEARPELREIQPGRLADVPPDGLVAAFLGAFSGPVTRDTRFLAGETFGSLADRVLACLAELLADRGWKRLLVVAHGGVNRTILAHALGAGLAGVGVLEQDPGCVNLLEVDDGGRFLVRLVNHTPYDAAKQGLEGTTMERLFLQYRAGGHRPR